MEVTNLMLRRALATTALSVTATLGLCATTAGALCPVPSPHPAPKTGKVSIAPLPSPYPNPEWVQGQRSFIPTPSPKPVSGTGKASIAPLPSP